MTVTNLFRSRLLAAALLAVVVAGCASETPSPTPAATRPVSPGAFVPGTTTPPESPGTSGQPTASGEPSTSGETSTVPTSPGTSPTTAPTASPTPAPTSYPPIPGLESMLGTDGRLSVLLLGSDARKGLGGERTDTIMVLSIVPTTGRVSVASLPRDVETVPIGPGDTYRAKVTGLYQSFKLASSEQEEAAQKTKAALGYAFGTEIDRYVFIGFDGVRKLVDAVGGVDITLPKALNDPHIEIKPGVRGLHLVKGVNHLDGYHALAYARVRKIDTDYARAARQQRLMLAAADAVRKNGVANLPALVEVATKSIRTDIPLESAPALFELIGRADLATRRLGVLGPRKYASQGGSRYTIIMIPAAVRALFDSWFAPVTTP